MGALSRCGPISEGHGFVSLVKQSVDMPPDTITGHDA